MPGTKVSFDKTRCKKKIESGISVVQKKLDSQVMKDANYFCPLDTGALQKSVLGSVIGSGLLTWAIDYAKKMYNFKGKLRTEPTKDKDGNITRETNPNASVKWFEVAKSRYREKWVRLVNDGFGKRS